MAKVLYPNFRIAITDVLQTKYENKKIQQLFH